MGVWIVVESICSDDLQPAGIACSDLRKRRKRPIVTLDRDQMPCARGKERARQSARTGADLDDIDILQWTRRAGDARGEIEIEQKVLSERFLGVKAVTTDDVPKRGKVINRAHARHAT